MASAANDTPDFDVDVLSSTEGSMAPETDGAELASWSLVVEDAAASEMEASLNPEQRFRQAAYRFFRLPHSKKDKIARCLDPKGETSAAPAGLERYKAVLAKARDSGVVDQLESMIVTAERE